MNNVSNMTNRDIVSEGLQSVAQAAKFLGVSKSFAYRLITSGVLVSTKIGKARRVPIRAVRELAANSVVQPTSLSE